MRIRWPICLAVAMALMLSIQAEPVEALDFQIGSDVSVDVDVEVGYAAKWRLRDQDNELLSDVNADDGNRSFDKGDMVNNKLMAIADIDLKYKNIGAFVRPRIYYDWAYDGINSNNYKDANGNSTNNNGPYYGGPLTDGNQFTDATQDLHRDKAEVLDAFVYGNFTVADRELDVRVGRHVVSWGESLLIGGGISSAMSPADGTMLNSPGTELKEVFLPVEQVSFDYEVARNLTFAGYYQWKWRKTRIDEQGSYFSDTDILYDAGYRYINGFEDSALDKGPDKDASDSGQWGVAFRYLTPGLNDTEFGFYFINYHDKVPQVKFKGSGGVYSPTAQALGGVANPGITGLNTIPYWGNLPVGGGINMGEADVLFGTTNAINANYGDSSSYYVEYAENIKLYGLSFGTAIGNTNVSGEVSYRQDLPIKVKDSNPANLLGTDYKLGNSWQAQVSAIHVFSSSPIWDILTVTAEVAANGVDDYGDAQLVYDRTAWGGVVTLVPEYLQVLNGLDLAPFVTYDGNFDGTSSVIGSFVEGADSLSFGIDFTYNVVYLFGVEYTDYLRGGGVNSLADRDTIGCYMKYTF